MKGGRRLRALVICAHLRPGRNKRKSKYLMQPIGGLHIASLLDRGRFEVRLHHEDWHGPFDTSRPVEADIVFLTGLQVDFDRMRQLAFFCKKSGATVVAGGSVCTVFPDFAARFFDAVCVGGVESAADVAEDFLRGRLARIYRSPVVSIRPYLVDYRHFAMNGISPPVHLIESSRGCSFRCAFCVMPSEVGAHARYDLSELARAIESSIASAPLLSFRRWYPIVLLLDNNFSDDREHMLAVGELMRSHKKIRGWGALVTQNVLRNRELIKRLAHAKCNGLFVGLESLDRALLARHNKTQNLGHGDVIEDIMFAESLGIGVTYGYLFDPRSQTAVEMERQIRSIERHPAMPMPTYVSVIAPLAGTELFWEELNSGGLAPNLRLRDLDGETLAFSRLADDPDAIVAFVERMFRKPWLVVSRLRIVLKTLRRIARSGTLNPIRWYFVASANFHCFIWSRAEVCAKRTYRAGSETLDPQYFERPADLTDADRERYFDPIALTDASGAPMEWIKPYLNQAIQRKIKPRGVLNELRQRARPAVSV